MKTRILQIFLCLSLVLVYSLPANAVDRYISDILIVTLRDAPSRSSVIIGHLRSGDYMTILEEAENGYIKVRISTGATGWIPKKYTAEGKSKDTLIRDFKKHVATLESLNTTQKDNNANLTSQINQYQATIDTHATTEAKQEARILDLETQVAEAQDKYITLKEQSEGVEAIFSERDTLVQENDLLTKETTVLKIENRELDQTRNIFWFLAGAGVLLIGCIIGRSGRKNRRNSLTL